MRFFSLINGLSMLTVSLDDVALPDTMYFVPAPSLRVKISAATSPLAFMVG